MADIIQFPPQKHLEIFRAIEESMNSLKDLYEGMERLQETYWKLVARTTELNLEYQRLLNELIPIVGIEGIPKELLDFAWVVVDPRTGEIVYTKDDEE